MTLLLLSNEYTFFLDWKTALNSGKFWTLFLHTRHYYADSTYVTLRSKKKYMKI